MIPARKLRRQRRRDRLIRLAQALDNDPSLQGLLSGPNANVVNMERAAHSLPPSAEINELSRKWTAQAREARGKQEGIGGLKHIVTDPR